MRASWNADRESYVCRQVVAPFFSSISGLVSWSRPTGESRFHRVAQTKTDGVLVRFLLHGTIFCTRDGKPAS